MTSPDLPAELKAALDGKLRGFSRNDAAGRAASISKTYRDGGGSGAIRSEADALAYALARIPATYAAVIASLNALVEIKPDFAPNSLLDVGAATGRQDGKCPLQRPDGCHFTQRLQRSRAHKQVKGAELPFEDEKFAYVALTRAQVAQRPSRVLAQPALSKIEVTAKLCTTD